MGERDIIDNQDEKPWILRKLFLFSWIFLKSEKKNPTKNVEFQLWGLLGPQRPWKGLLKISFFLVLWLRKCGRTIGYCQNPMDIFFSRPHLNNCCLLAYNIASFEAILTITFLCWILRMRKQAFLLLRHTLCQIAIIVQIQKASIEASGHTSRSLSLLWHL